MAIEKIGRDPSNGVVLGQNPAALVAFHGATPTDQCATIAKPASTGATSSTPYGYTEEQANAIVTAVRSIIDVLIEKGLIAAS